MLYLGFGLFLKMRTFRVTAAGLSGLTPVTSSASSNDCIMLHRSCTRNVHCIVLFCIRRLRVINWCTYVYVCSSSCCSIVVVVVVVIVVVAAAAAVVVVVVV